MKEKISITVSEEIYKKIMEVWKREQEGNLKSSHPRPIKFSETAERLLEKGLKK